MSCHTWFYRPIKENEIAEEEDEGYVDLDIHDVFRIGGYPDDQLFSLEETMAFIECNKDRITFTENWEETLKKFWLLHPDGKIQFG